MTKKTHRQAAYTAILGVTALPITTQLTGSMGTEEKLTAFAIFAASTIFGALLSDIDDEVSTISKIFPHISRAITKRSNKKNAFRHRHFFHSFEFAFLFMLLAAVAVIADSFVTFSVLSGLGIGVTSHVITDWIMSKTYLSSFINRGFSLFHLEGKPAAQRRLDKIFRVLLCITNVFLVIIRVQNIK